MANAPGEFPDVDLGLPESDPIVDLEDPIEVAAVPDDTPPSVPDVATPVAPQRADDSIVLPEFDRFADDDDGAATSVAMMEEPLGTPMFDKAKKFQDDVFQLLERERVARAEKAKKEGARPEVAPPKKPEPYTDVLAGKQKPSPFNAFGLEGMVDEEMVRLGITKAETKDSDDRDRSAGLLSTLGLKDGLTAKEAAEHTEERLKTAKSRESYWRGVLDKVLVPMRERAQPGTLNPYTAPLQMLPSQTLAWAEERVGRNISESQREQFLANEALTTPSKQAKMSTTRNVVDSVARGALDTGVGKSVSGVGSLYEYKGKAEFAYGAKRADTVVGKAAMTLGMMDLMKGKAVAAIGDWISKVAVEQFPEDEARQAEWGTLIGNGAGTMVAIVGPSMGASLLTRASPQSLKILAAGSPEEAAKLMAAAAKTQKRAATSTGTGMGAMMQAEGEKQSAEEAAAAGKPVTAEDIAATYFWNIIPGASESLPLANLWSAPAGAFIRNVLREAIEEGGQEWAQSVASNVIAQNYYDPERKWDEGAWEGAVVGHILGGSMAGLHQAGAGEKQAGEGEAPRQEAKVRGGKGGATMTDAGENSGATPGVDPASTREIGGFPASGEGMETISPAADEPEFSARIKSKDKSVDENDLQAYLSMYRGKGEAEEKEARKSLKALDDYAASREMQWSIENGDIVMRDRHGVAATGAANADAEDLARMAARDVKAFGRSTNDFMALDNYLADEGLDIAKKSKPSKDQGDFVAKLAETLREPSVSKSDGNYADPMLEETERPGEFGVASYDAFRRVLATNAPAKSWQSRLGVSDDQMKTLVAQAKRDGYVRGKRGKWLRTPAAKTAADGLAGSGKPQAAPAVGETVRFKGNKGVYRVDVANPDGSVMARRWNSVRKAWAGKAARFQPDAIDGRVGNPDRKAAKAQRVEPTLSMPAEAAAELQARPAVPVSKSITPNHIISLLDGSRHVDLRPHLEKNGLTARQYADRFGLPDDYYLTSPLSRWREGQEAAPAVTIASESAATPPPETGEFPIEPPANVEMLKGVLESYGIDTSEFGKGSSKTLGHLRRELESGEARLVVKDGTLLRRVEAAGANVYATVGGRRLRLYEAQQAFNDGRTRTRNLSASLAEKMTANEEPAIAALRGVREELGIDGQLVSDVTTRTERGDSQSYPGLPAEYVLHSVDVEVAESDFRSSYRETQDDKTTTFGWRDAATGDAVEMQAERGSPEDLERREAAAREIMLRPEYAKASDIDNPVLRTKDIPGYGTDAWKAQREYRDGDTVIKGWRKAVVHLGEKAFDAIPGGPRYERTAFMLIGYPGAGKSSIADAIRREHGAAHVVADDAKVIIPEYAGGMNSSGVHDESSELNDEVARYVYATGANIILEKLGNSNRSVEGMMEGARSQGYTKFVLIHVDVPKAVAMERAIGRWRRSGRAVPLYTYETLRADKVYGYIKDGKADEATHIIWDERALRWGTTESGPTLQGLVIPDRPDRSDRALRSDQQSPQGDVGADRSGAAGRSLEEQGQEAGIAGTIERAADERAAEAGRDLNPDVVDLAERVARVADAGLDVSVPLAGANLNDEDARDLAALVGYPSDESSAADALSTITDRAKALKEGIDADRRLLEQSAATLPGGQVSGGVQADEGERITVGGMPAGGRGGSGRGTGSADSDGEFAGSAEPGVRGEGQDAGGSAAEGAGDRSEGRDRAAALDAIEEERAEAAPYNYQITDEDEIGKGGPKAKVRGNIEAIRVIRRMEEEGRTLATAEEKSALVKYVGWGAFAQDVFATHKPEWAKERQQLADLLSAEEMRTARASTTNAHYTSPEVIRGMWDALEHFGVAGWNIRALEPASGVGHFIGLQPEAMQDDTSWTAVELDQISGKITKALYGAADVRVQGFETVNWPDNHFDLAVSNVPFAEQGPYDPAYKKSMTLHDYFFVKSLDKVRPGGIVAFITSAGTMDKASTAVRRRLADKATMIGAIRLPGGSKGAFKANAGTDVTTDIIFLRKRVDGEPLGDRSWIETAEIKTPEGPTKINQYFIDNPDMMLGKMRLQGTMYSPNQPVLIGPTDAMQTRIREAAERMQADAFVPRGHEAGVLDYEALDTETDGIKEGALYEKDGKLFRKVMGVGQPQKFSKADEAVARSFLEVRDAANALLSAQAGNVSAVGMGALRFDLNEAYDAFVQLHGPINKTVIRKQKRADRTITIRQKPNMAVFRADPDAHKIAALENYNEETGSAAKTAIFSEDVIEAYERPPIAGPTDALAVSINEMGRVDMAFIAERLGVSEADAVAELGDLVYLNPVGEKWEIAGQYLAGDVVEKLDVARGAAELDARYARNVVALTEAQPQRIPREDIAVQFGGQWVPAGVYEDFIREVLGVRIKVSLTEQTAEWNVGRGYFPPSAQAQFGTNRADVGRVLADTLNNKRLLISDTVYDPATRSEKSVPNPQATMEANARADALRQAFQDWKYQDEARAQELEDIYNQRFNRLAPEQYDGSHLTFPGLARVVSFPDGTKGQIRLGGDPTGDARVNTIWRIIQKGNTLIDHTVGAGKAQPLDAKLLTPNGWKRMGDIAVGDEVISADGKPTRVLGVFPQGEKDIYRVTFSDGSSTECCDEHLWLTQTYRERDFTRRAERKGIDASRWDCAVAKVRSLEEIRASIDSGHSVPFVAPVEFDATDELPIDPYVLGALLGDGFIGRRDLVLISNDPEIVNEFTAALGHEAVKPRRLAGQWGVTSSIRPALAGLGLVGCRAWEKFVPQAYKFASVSDRIAILQGLLDTDGSVNAKGTPTFHTTSEVLAADVSDLVMSLGGTTKRCVMTSNRPRPCYYLLINLPAEVQPFRLCRKLSAYVPRDERRFSRRIVAVDLAGRKPAQCIAVENPSHLYVTDDFIVTHNTWTMIMSGMEQKRLGLIQRPAYIVPNHMLEQFSTEFLQAYPNAKLLVASKDEMTLAKRKEFAGKIAAEKWDGIIITHDAFGRIAMSDAAYQEFFKEQMEELEAAKRDVDKDDRPTVKRLEKAKKALETKLAKYTAKERKDAGATFEELGVDFLYVDEAHLFKNLGFATKQQRVKGVNAQSQSQRAMDLFVKIRYLEKLRPGRAAVFATGTPISNTMAELFVMQRYLQLDELQRFKIDRFDAWASTFGSIVTKMELAPDGRTFRESSSFSEFVNIPELNAIWSRIADTKTADQLQLPRPALKNGRPTVIEAEPSEFELDYIKELIERAEAVKKGSVDPEEDNMLKIVSEGRKIATDGRLIANKRELNPNGKIARAVEEIYSRWQSGKEPALVQMVFLDMGVPGGKSVAKPGAKKKKGKRSEIEEIQDELIAEAGQDQDSDEPNLEASELISGAFDLYADLKQRLIDKGIPAEQIAFIHDAKGDDGKARLFADVKAAKVRVLFGSTPKMGVGTNVQKRLIAMHHLDAPWKPAEVEQRDGRILRQGNMNKEVEILRYVTRASFDSYMWQTLERKANFINQYKSGQRGARRMEDIDNPLPEAALLKAAASGDPRILEHAELGKVVQSLESARAAHFNAARSAKAAIEKIEKSLAGSEKYIVGYEADAAMVQDLSGENFIVDLTEIAPENGANVTERTKAGEAIRAYIAGLPYWGQNGDKYLGTISGFRFGYTVKRTDQGLEGVAFIEGEERYKATSTSIITETSNPLPLIQRFERLVKDMPLMLKAAQINRDRNSKDLPRLRQQAEGGEFPQQAQLDTAKARVAALEAALKPQEATGEVAPAQEIPEGKVSIEDFASEVAEVKDRLGVRERPKSQLIGDNVEDAEIVTAALASQPAVWAQIAAIEDSVPDSVERSIERWVGGPRRAGETDYPGGGFSTRQLNDAYSDNPSERGLEVRREIDAAAAPIKAALRAAYGDTITVYRGVRPTNGQLDSRNVFSYTTDPRTAAFFTGAARKPMRVYTEEEIAQAERDLAKNGEATLGRITYRPSDFEGSTYLDMFDRNGDFITDTPSIRDSVESDNAYAREQNAERDGKLANVVRVEMPIENVIWATDRFNQQEIIARPLEPGFVMAALASDPLADIIRIIRQEAENGRNAEGGRGGSPDGQGGSPAGELAGAGGAATAGRQTVEVTRNGILAAAQRVYGGASSQEVEAKRKAQGFTRKGWHSTISRPYDIPEPFLPGHDFGFHVAIGSPRAANNRVLYPTSIIDKVLMMAESLGRFVSRGAKPLKSAPDASLMPLWIKAEKPLRLPDMGDWADPWNWLSVLEVTRGVPKGLGQWITAWMDQNRYQSRRDQIVQNHEFSRAVAAELERRGYDSVIYKNVVEDTKDSLFVWNAAQVRSAFDTFDDRAIGQPGLMASLPHVQADARARLQRLAEESGLDGIVLASLGSQSTDLTTLPQDIERGVAALKEGSRLAIIREGMQTYKAAVDETLALAAKSKNVHIPEDASAAQLTMLQTALNDVIGIIQGRMETNDQLEATLGNLEDNLKGMAWDAFNDLDSLSQEADSVQEDINDALERFEDELGEAYWLTPEERATEDSGEEVDDPVLLRDTPEHEAAKALARDRALAMPTYPEGASLVDIFRLDAVEWRAAVDQAKADLVAAETEAWAGGATVEKAIAFWNKTELISTSLTAFMGHRIRELLQEQYERMDANITESLEGLQTEFIQPTYSDLMDAESEVDSVLDDVNTMIEEREAGPATAAVASTPAARISTDALLKALREDQDARASLEAELRRALPPNIAIRIMDRVRHKAFGDNELRGLAQVSGDRSRGSVLISRALGDDVARRTIRHETIHVLRQLGLFLDSEWALLVREARKRAKIVDERGNDREADYLTNYRRNLSAMGLTGAALDAGVQEYMDQEFVAHFAEIYEEGNVKVGAKTRTLLDRLRDAMQAFLNWRAGNGLMTDAEVTEAGLAEVLGKARSGAIASRYAGNVPGAPGLVAAAISANHGSPHTFDRFSTDKIGSGEGAQVYGWGLYFAENPQVAAYYKGMHKRGRQNMPAPREMARRTLADVRMNTINNRPIRSALPAAWRDYLDRREAIRDLRETGEALGGVYFSTGGLPQNFHVTPNWNDVDVIKEVAGAITALRKRQEGMPDTSYNAQTIGTKGPADTSAFYEVELDVSPYDLLDLDKSFNEQTPMVRHALRGMHKNSPGFMESKGAVSWLETATGDSLKPRNREEAQALVAAGIPGLRYRDAFSRGDVFEADATYNYVIFDDSRITLKTRNGEAVEGVDKQAAVTDVQDQMMVMAALASAPGNVVTAAMAASTPPAPKGYSRPAKGISDLIADVRETLGKRSYRDPDPSRTKRVVAAAASPVLGRERAERLSGIVQTQETGFTHRHGRLDPALKRQARAAGGEPAGQYSSRTGVLRTALPNDWATFTHEAGHFLERRRGFAGTLDAMKVKFAKELMGSPPADVQLPQGGLKTDGFSGVELDYEQQNLLAEAILAAAKATAPGAATDLTLNEAGMHTVEQLQGEAEKTRQALDNAVGAAVADQLMGLASQLNVISRFGSGKSNNPLRVQLRSDEEIKDQLRAELAQRFSASGEPAAPAAQSFSRLELSEAFAEFFRAFLTNQDAARKRAPGFFDAFEDALNASDPGLFDQLDAIHDAYQALQKSDPMGMVASRFKSTVAEHGIIGQFIADLREKGAKETFAGVWDSISLRAYGAYASYIDGKHPMNVAVKALLEQARINLGGKLANDARVMIKAINDPYKRLRLAEHSKGHATAILQHGVILNGSVDPVGPSLWDALEVAFGGTKRGQWNEELGEPFNAYLGARRMVAEFDRFETTNKEMGDHLTPKETWAAAVADFEAQYPQFKQAAAALYQFNQNLLTWKLQQGFLTQDVYDELSKRTDYVPLQRIMDDQGFGLTSLKTKNKGSLIKTFKGSNRDIIAPLEAIMADVYATTNRVAINGVIRTLDTLARAAGPGGGAIAERLPAKEYKGTRVHMRDVLNIAKSVRKAARRQGLDASDTASLLDDQKRELRDAAYLTIKQAGLDKSEAADLLNTLDMLFDAEASKTIFQLTDTSEKGEPIVWLWENGERVPIRLGDNQVGKDLFQLFVGMGAQNENDIIINTTLGAADLLRAGITRHPGYIMVNYLRDQFSTWMHSSAFTPFATGARGLKSVLKNDVWARRYSSYAGLMGPESDVAHRASHAGGYTLSEGMEHDPMSLRGKGIFNSPTAWGRFLKATEVTEAGTRVGHFAALFERYKAEGMTDEEAMFEAAYSAHDVIDFSRRGGGAVAGFGARAVTFLNAAVQDLDSARRTIKPWNLIRGRFDGERDELQDLQALATPYLSSLTGENPLMVGKVPPVHMRNSFKIWVKMASLMTFSLMLAALYADDDEINEIGDDIRATHWIFRDPFTGRIRRVPKPFQYAAIANIGEAAFDRFYQGDERWLQKIWRGMKATFALPYEPPLLGLFYETKANKDFYSGRPITAKELAALPPEQQFNAYTSEFGRLIGGAMGLSPVQIDHWVAGMFGSLGRDALTMSNFMLPRINQATGGAMDNVSKEPRADTSPEDWIIMSRFSRRAARGSLSGTRFWEQMGQEGGKFVQAAAGLKGFAKSGQFREAQDFLNTLDDNRKAYALMETFLTEEEQDAHPLRRAEQVMATTRGIRKAMVLEKLYRQEDTKGGAVSARETELNRIKVTPKTAMRVNEILEDIAMREARNALIVIGDSGWQHKRIMPTKALMDELKVVAPEIHEELVYRMENGANKVYPFESVAAAWPAVRDAVLKGGMQVDRGDIAGEISDAATGEDTKDKPYLLERKAEPLPGMMRLGGPLATPMYHIQDETDFSRVPPLPRAGHTVTNDDMVLDDEGDIDYEMDPGMEIAPRMIPQMNRHLPGPINSY